MSPKTPQMDARRNGLTGLHARKSCPTLRLLVRAHACLILGFLVSGLAWSQEPPAEPDDPPVRLKKKRSGPTHPEPVKPALPEEKKEPPKKEEAKPEPEPPPLQEDEAEVLARVAQNVRLAEEKLANKELNAGTRQLQEDILKDLDSLIRSAESPQGGDGGGDDPNRDQSNDSDKSKSSAKSQSGPGSMGKSGAGQQRSTTRASRTRQGKGSQQANRGGRQGGPSDNQQARRQPSGPGGPQGNAGNNPGDGRADPPQGPPDKNADLYKDVWGHLPESLRAEMNAYSNDKQFMAKYDELIKRYYRTIAEQGRKKGD